ncbi:MAG TPA: transposase [Blastocatellia bacterium]|nr:transposase [Blastocatellia bacterium]
MGQVVKGLEFFVLSLVDVTQRQAYPLAVQQTVRSAAEKQALKERKKPRAKRAKKTKGKPKGRPPGSRNKDKNEVKWSPELLRINELLGTLLKLLRVFVGVKYLALDGHLGHQQAVLLAQQNGLQLISKLRKDAALYEKYDGAYRGRGPQRKYGARLNYEQLPPKYLKQSETQGDLCTQYYQGLFLHPEFAQALNAVIIVKTNLKTQKVGHVILFSSDAELGWEQLVDYYSLRFQIEFNFRDAKQHFGLEDFMNTTATGVENAANLSFLLVNVSAKMRADSAAKEEGVLDLKTRFRGCKYALEAIKMLLENPETIISPAAIEDVQTRISQLGRIHRPKAAASSA